MCKEVQRQEVMRLNPSFVGPELSSGWLEGGLGVLRGHSGMTMQWYDGHLGSTLTFLNFVAKALTSFILAITQQRAASSTSQPNCHPHS